MDEDRDDTLGLPVPQVPLPDARLVKSAERVLRVFEFFDDIQRPARAAEIARQLGVPQSSASMLLRSLVTLGYVDYDPETRRYLPSPRVMLLGGWLGGGAALHGRLGRMLSSLSEATGDTIILAARNGIHAQYLHVVPARSALRFHVPQGTRRLLVRSATGYALLSTVSDEEIAGVLRRTNAGAAAGGEKLALPDVLAGVAAARARGYAFSRQLVTAGAGSIAMPLPPSMDGFNRPLAIANSGLIHSIEARRESIVAAMRAVIGEAVQG
jgi:DNA-binding IclR family transcriptional regulator